MSPWLGGRFEVTSHWGIQNGVNTWPRNHVEWLIFTEIIERQGLLIKDSCSVYCILLEGMSWLTPGWFKRILCSSHEGPTHHPHKVIILPYCALKIPSRPLFFIPQPKKLQAREPVKRGVAEDTERTLKVWLLCWVWNPVSCAYCHWSILSPSQGASFQRPVKKRHHHNS